MGRMIAIGNQKGGVGKTTTTVNLGAALAFQGKKVLIIDMDSQGNATSGLGIERADVKQSVYEVLVDQIEAAGAILPTSRENLWILPSTLQLAGAEIELATADHRESRLKQAIEPIKADYDYILVDCPPSLGQLSLNAFTASDTILIPVQCEYYALEGLSQLLNTIRLVQRTYVRLSEAPSYGQSVIDYDPKSRGAEMYMDLAKEVAANG